MFVCSFVLSSSFRNVCGNSKDIARFGEIVKTLCDQTVLSIIIACYILRKKILELQLCNTMY